MNQHRRWAKRLRYSGLTALLGMSLLCGCGGGGSGLEHVPRNRTLIMDCAEINVCGGQFQDYNTFNPFAPGVASRTGWNFAFEPLFYYNAFVDDDNLIPWLANGYE